MRIEAVGCALALSLCALVVVRGGIGRPGSIIGALGALGMLVVAPPLLAAVRSRVHSVSGALIAWAHVALVIWSGRVAGRLAEPEAALVVWAVGAVLLGTAWIYAERYRLQSLERRSAET
jgi:hypothetical protein